MRNQMAGPREEQLISQAIARLRAGALAIVCGLLAGTLLFIATLWLVILGGDQVGPHLGLLANFLPGYRVSWGGAALGFVYGLLIGGIAGWSTAWIYNFVVTLRDPG